MQFNTFWTWEQNCTHWVSYHWEILLQAQEHHQCLYNREARLTQFTVGDKVFVLLPSSISNYSTHQVARAPCDHTASGWRWLWSDAVRQSWGATQMHHVNFLKAWREAQSVSLVQDRDELESWGAKLTHSHLTPFWWPPHDAPESRCCKSVLRICLTTSYRTTLKPARACQRIYRFPEHKRQIVPMELAAMLLMGQIEESHKAWCVPTNLNIHVTVTYIPKSPNVQRNKE